MKRPKVTVLDFKLGDDPKKPAPTDDEDEKPEKGEPSLDKEGMRSAVSDLARAFGLDLDDRKIDQASEALHSYLEACGAIDEDEGSESEDETEGDDEESPEKESYK